MKKNICRICSNGEGQTQWLCREKMFGWGDSFTYFQCGQCGCLQIAEVPENLSRYYPPDYYSFRSESLPQQGFRSGLAARRDLAAATGRGLFGLWLSRLFPARDDVACLSRVPAKKNMRILDVGCGQGWLLHILRRAGFRHLMGADPFLPADFAVLPSLSVHKRELKDVEGKFDLIMLHHVFEHMEFPERILANGLQRLVPGGKMLLRFPTVESEAWEIYRENWVQLDAPRHFFLHTRKSLELLADRTGLRIERYWWDSGSFQFWASELYQKGIPLADKSANPAWHFTKARMKQFSRRAAELNAAGRGDQCVAVLAAKTQTGRAR